MSKEYVKFVRGLRDENLAKIDHQIEVCETFLAKAEADEEITNEDQTLIKAQRAYLNLDEEPETGGKTKGSHAGMADSYRQQLEALRRRREFLLEMSGETIQSARDRSRARKTGTLPSVRL